MEIIIIVIVPVRIKGARLKDNIRAIPTTEPGII
jgi:hypothetical protein